MNLRENDFIKKETHTYVNMATETATPWKQPINQDNETVIYAEAEEENVYGRLGEAQSNGIYFDVEHKGQFLEPLSNFGVDRRCSIVSTTSSTKLMPFLDCMETVEVENMPFLSSTSISPSEIAQNMNDQILPRNRNISPIALKETRTKSKISMATNKKMKSLSDMKFNLL
jgi:hypothetical protein